jgi:hypothetical protein
MWTHVHGGLGGSEGGGGLKNGGEFCRLLISRCLTLKG